MSDENKTTEFDEIEIVYPRIENLPRLIYACFFLLTIVGLGGSVFYTFGMSWRGTVMLDSAYYFFFMGMFMPLAFLSKPARSADKKILPWYDIVLSILALSIPLFIFFPIAERVTFAGLVPAPPQYLIPAAIFILLTIETGRRVAGNSYVIICLVFGLYPLVAERMPGLIYGFGFDLPETISLVVFGAEGILGVPIRVLANLLVGFLLFAGFMIASGAGEFLLRLALALAGSFRGGPAKVAVLASGFFGSLSGSGMTNVATTGSVTIPIMKKMGFDGCYAGAIETVGSVGGAIMPPVMGGFVFVMATFLGVEYAEAMVAGIIPAFLYYLSLMIGVDAHAAKTGLKGIPKNELPEVKEVLKKGWFFLFVLFFLIFGLVYMRWGMRTPFYATVLLFFLSFTSKRWRLTPRKLVAAFISAGRLIAQATAILLPMGFILNALISTGVTASLTGAVIRLGGENVILVMIIGLASCYIMGMAGLLTPAYIFLAVTLAPAVVRIGGLDRMAVHFAIAYYCMLTVYTLPVAAAAFIAASIADAPPMKTAFTSMKLGMATYFIPFFFAFNPALILRGTWVETLYLLPLAILGVIILAASIEGYLFLVGKLPLFERIGLVIAGILIAFPHIQSSIIGIILVVICVSLVKIRFRNKEWNTGVSELD